MEKVEDSGCSLHPAVASWFAGKFGEPTAPQRRGWPAIGSWGDVLIAAPTGSGKTLAAFLAAIDGLVRDGIEGRLGAETRAVNVSPLKALSNDIRRDLEEPLAGIRARLKELGLPAVEITAEVRTGDTPASERQAMVRRPPHLLLTTPESFYLLLTSESGRWVLRTARALITDEIHAVAGGRRGAHLSLSMERLDALCGRPLQRIGHSAGGSGGGLGRRNAAPGRGAAFAPRGAAVRNRGRWLPPPGTASLS